MVKFLARKNVKRILALLCISAVLFSVCRTRVAAEIQHPNATETEKAHEDRSLYKPWGANPLEFNEYSLELMAQWLDVDTFISAEMLHSRFGNFDNFTFYVDTEKYDGISGLYVTEYHTDAYVYMFQVETGGRYNIDIAIEKLQPDGVVRHLPEARESIGADDIDPEDLRKANKPGTYQVGNIGYTYVYYKKYDETYSNLTYFQWISDGYAFLINTNESEPEQYDLNDGGFMAQMLRQETAHSAVKQFSRDLFPSQYPDESPNIADENNKNWMIWVVPSAVAVLGIVATLFVSFRRKKSQGDGLREPLCP